MADEQEQGGFDVTINYEQMDGVQKMTLSVGELASVTLETHEGGEEYIEYLVAAVPGAVAAVAAQIKESSGE